MKVVYETDAGPLLDWLPPKLTRSSPPYAVMTVAYFPESPVGEFSLAAQYLGCRAGLFIRAFTLQAVTDNTAALVALREIWGYPCRPGAVGLRLGEEGVTAQASADGASLVAIELAALREIEGALVRFDPVLNLRVLPSLQEGKRHDLVQLVQIDPDYDVGRASRASATIKFPAREGGATWGVLPVRNVISAVYCELHTEMPLARFVMPY